MMRWKSLLVLAVSSIVASACTVTVDDDPDTDGDGDNSDLTFGDQESSPDFGDSSGFEPISDLGSDEESTEEVTATESETTTAPVASDDAGAPTTEAPATTDEATEADGGSDESSNATDETTATGEDTASETSPASSDSETGDTATDDTTATGMHECELPDSEAPSCEACLDDSCEDAYYACGCDTTCAAQLTAVRACFEMKHTFDNPSDAPNDDFAACEEEVGGDDGLSDKYYDVTSCAGEGYVPPADSMEEDPYGRTEGDGLCSAACFQLYTFE
jgi:hypothetical protein